MARVFLEVSVGLAMLSALGRLGDHVGPGDVCRIWALAALTAGVVRILAPLGPATPPDRPADARSFKQVTSDLPGRPLIAIIRDVLLTFVVVYVAAALDGPLARAFGLTSVVGMRQMIVLAALAAGASLVVSLGLFAARTWWARRTDPVDMLASLAASGRDVAPLSDDVLAEVLDQAVTGPKAYPALAAVPRADVAAALRGASDELARSTDIYHSRYLRAKDALAVRLGLHKGSARPDLAAAVLGPIAFAGSMTLLAVNSRYVEQPWRGPAIAMSAAGLCLLATWGVRRWGGPDRLVRSLRSAAIGMVVAAVTASLWQGVASSMPWIPLGVSAAVVGVAGLVAGSGRYVYARRRVTAAAMLESDSPARWHDADPRHLGGDAMRIAEQAREEWLAALVRSGQQILSRWLTSTVAPVFDLTVPQIAVEELGDVTEVGHFVPTEASSRTEGLVATMRKAAIGVSGRRGSGKTSLLRLLGDDRLGPRTPGLRLILSAPTEYDRREFLIHLFIEFCEKVDPNLSTNSPDGPHIWWQRGWNRRTVAVAAVAGVILVVAGALVAFENLLSLVQQHPLQTLLTVAAAVGGVVTAIATRDLLRSMTARDRSVPRVVWLARRYHAQLRYLETHTLTHTAGLKSSVGLEFGGSRSRQRAPVALSYPQLVDEFRRYLDEVGLYIRSVNADAKMVICIDELDKIATVEAAERFINDIKAVFGVDGCYFVVSVSEDALAGFAQRTLSVRGTFDSAFDTIVEVGPFDLDHTRRLLVGRLGRLPEPIVWLCHSFAGGLPRDVNRATRTIHDLTINADVRTVGDLARHLIADEASAAFPTAEHFTPADILDWLNRTARAHTAPDDRSAYVVWALTVLEALSAQPERTVEVMRHWYATTGPRQGSPIDRLARIRHRLAAPSPATWATLSAVRDELGLAP
jgi:hypothetical protein